MRRLAVCFAFVSLLGACATPSQPVAPAQEDHSGEVKGLLAQDNIDPLTAYLDQYADDAGRASAVAEVRTERDKRCAAVAKLYDGREKTPANAARLRTAYRHSCPAVVEVFQRQVAKAVRNTPAAAAPAPESAPPPADAPGPAAAIAPSGAIAGQLLDNCYLLVRIENYQEALDACAKPAELGDAKAEDGMAVSFRALRKYPDALVWARRAAAQNLPDGEYQLGDLLHRGAGTARDDAEALRYFQKAGQEGVAEAQYAAGSMVARGEGTARDDAQARAWYALAADQGFARAELSLGEIYATGTGVAPDAEQARIWLTKAAGQGLAQAQRELGELYMGGRGIPADDYQAYVWFSLAALNGDAAAAAPRDVAAARLTSEQIDQAQHQIRRTMEDKR
ncbi:hypothetical protein GCM10011611_62790 [Aliidongia dinghuensis]|uniref:Sel1 repeat family protein n=1 Tax=Aliidongia dinghuensis TaxID=1867774 RepID=A0A8J2YZV7_9PROT|nr:tetratricopeptide repeat protein [Aliidongia dinghuensis]GGF47806.1 hypothetical protein GCM10011611_62790 [Aliidongia dinghuensis]